jgi:HKD family nuclease
MFKITLFSKRDSVSGIASSKLYDENTFYDAFAKDIRYANRSVVIESPFLTERRVQQFVKLLSKKTRSGVKITIYTRNPAHHNKTLEIQAWKSIKLLRGCGVKALITSDMRHRKLAIIDDHVLWEGSLNILSQNNSRELMRRTASKDMCSQILRFTSIAKELRWYNWK